MARYMPFTHPKVVEYVLSGKSLVATMRNYPRKPGEWLVAHLHLGRGSVLKLLAHVIDCVPATKDNIERFTEYSGFKTSEEWIKEAKKLHGGKKPRYIILIKILEG